MWCDLYCNVNISKELIHILVVSSHNTCMRSLHIASESGTCQVISYTPSIVASGTATEISAPTTGSHFADGLHSGPFQHLGGGW